ncbi:MFS general substrate transporter [Lindgomyces ingoldianus]|uniref:MFS general substrate transporter n=1 Tax=Lindgomyces ingoldianus TaxID=673940 RepID=A0ACB6QM80_9PLEO|nr:MFS general substrate transporter [Lindgomyces ingoldianus]KAF2468048.1 MFS general substrate transporter [Lindgomyces ingoldianus]
MELSATQYEYPTGISLAATLLSLGLGTFLMALDTTIITVAIPEISTHFNALDQVGWIGSAYLITLTAFQPIAGNLYKNFDPKITYLVFTDIFEVGSTLCAASPAVEVFILGRAIAGMGAAGLLQGALGILTYISPLEKRPLYMAVVISAFGITCSVGPVVGGVFTDRVTWRWCFWINLPLGFITFALVAFCLNLKQLASVPGRQLPLKTKLKRVDPIGMTLLLGFVSCLCIALQYGGNTDPWSSSRVVGLLVGFCLLKVLFWITQWRLGEHALIPVRFLRQRTVSFGSLFLFCENMSNYLKLYYLPFYFQAVLGTSAVRSGVNYIALAVPQFFALLLSGGLVTQFGHYMPVIMIGQVICAVRTGLMTQISTTTSAPQWAAFLAVTGIGLGMGINAPHIAIQAVMETDTDVFLANGVATFFSQLGGTIAIPIGNAFLLNGLGKYIPKYAKEIAVETVVHAGPLALNELSLSADTVYGLRLAYSKAIQHILIFALAVVCFSIPAASGMQWLNIKKVSQERKKRKTTSHANDNEQVDVDEKTE